MVFISKSRRASYHHVLKVAIFLAQISKLVSCGAEAQRESLQVPKKEVNTTPGSLALTNNAQLKGNYPPPL
jgi:hypothetical protein